EERVVQRVPPAQRRIDRDPQALLHLRLADELGKPLRPQRQLDGALLAQNFRRRDLRSHTDLVRGTAAMPPSAWSGPGIRQFRPRIPPPQCEIDWEERGGRSRDERQAGAQWCCVRGGRAHGRSARARLSAREPPLYPFGEMTAFSAALRRRADEALAGRLY